MTDDIKHESVLLAINKLALTRVRCFYPDYIAKGVKLSRIDAIKYLNELVKQKILIKRYNQICPRCFEQLGVYDDVREMPSKIECPRCFELVTNFPECIRQVFYFNQAYRDKIKAQQEYDFKQNKFGPYNDFVMDRFQRRY